MKVRMAYCFLPKHLNAIYIWILFPLVILLRPVQASNLTLADVCPPSSVYSPFKKWPPSLLQIPGPTENSACWYWAECILDQAQEVRKSQFTATSFVMGLVPLILKDIAWPERRQVLVPTSLNVVIEVLVRALGLVPIVRHDAKQVHIIHGFSKRGFSLATLLLLAFGVLIGFAASMVVEFYSKRSALGCPYPFFIFTWFIVALIPASIRKYISDFVNLV